MGFDGESKGMRVYWAGKRLVTVKRDVYFNKNEVLEPEEVQIEGEWNIPNSSTNFNSSHDTSSTLPAKSRTNETQNNDTNKQQTSENPPAVTYSNNQFNNQSKAINTIPFPTPEPPPVQRNCRNSLTGLPQFNSTDFGQGKRARNNPKDADTAIRNQSAFVIDDNELLVHGSVEIDVNKSEWFQEEVQNALVAYSKDEPTLKEVLHSGEKDKWWEAIEAELRQIKDLHTYDLVEAPSDANIIPLMFVFCQKRNEEGLIVRYRACLVAKGYKQKFGINYNETFAPTVRPATL